MECGKTENDCFHDNEKIKLKKYYAEKSAKIPV